MRRTQQNLLVVGLLVVVLAVIAWFLRTPSTPTDTAGGPTPSTSVPASGSPSVSPSPSASPSSGSATPSPSAAPITKVVFLGDSFAAGTGASAPDKRWTTLLATANGWTETNLAHPQTGYLQAGSTGDCTAETCPPFSALVPKVVEAAPELVIITGGANDLKGDVEAAKASVTTTLTALRAALPTAMIVVVNPWWDMRPENPGLAPYAEAIKAAAATAGVTYADLGQPISGKVTLVTSDGLNANDAGHAALADAVRAALRTAGIPVS